MSASANRSLLLDLATTALGLVDQGMSLTVDEVLEASRKRRLIDLVVTTNTRAPAGIFHGLGRLDESTQARLEDLLQGWLAAYGDRRKSGIGKEGLLLVAVAACWAVD